MSEHTTPGRSKRRTLPVAKEGIPFIALFFAVSLVLFAFSNILLNLLAVLSLLLSFFCLYFFRDPERNIVIDPAVVLAPGEGRILEVLEEDAPELGGKVKVVRIFLSVFNVHIQRSPVQGKVIQVRYQKGKFLDARDPRACFENEQNTTFIENADGKFAVKQIAGLIARRIVCWVGAGQSVGMGERIGLIRFGSQVDLYLPLHFEVCVKKGDPVAVGVSVVAVNPKAVAKV